MEIRSLRRVPAWSFHRGAVEFSIASHRFWGGGRGRRGRASRSPVTATRIAAAIEARLAGAGGRWVNTSEVELPKCSA